MFLRQPSGVACVHLTFQGEDAVSVRALCGSADVSGGTRVHAETRVSSGYPTCRGLTQASARRETRIGEGGKGHVPFHPDDDRDIHFPT